MSGIDLVFLGHSTLLVTVDGVRILTDPVLRHVWPLRRHAPDAPATDIEADVVLISHAHRDHLDLPTLHSLPGSPRIVVPAGLAGVLRSAGLHHVEEVAAGDAITVRDVTVTAFPALHDGFRPPLGPRAAALGFVIAGSSRVYFAGDTDIFPEMESLQGDTDLALLPVWGWGPRLGPGHLDPESAADAAHLIGASATVPIHWGGLFPQGFHRVWPTRLTEPPREFARSARRIHAATNVRILEPGESASFDGRG